jgi:hypothetical protein
MSTLDDIAQARQRLAERLAGIEAERAKLAEELADLEAAERVLSRFAEARPQSGGRRRRMTEPTQSGPAAAPPRRRGRPPATKPAVTPPSLGEATLRVIAAHPDGISAEEVRQCLAREFGMQVRANHLGMALQRHRRAGRLEQRDSLWFAPEEAGRAGEASDAGEPNEAAEPSAVSAAQ